MKLQRNIVGALLLLAACSEDHSGDTPRSKVGSSHAALGTVPASEIATWTQIAAPPASPDATFLQSAVFDETRKSIGERNAILLSPNRIHKKCPI
jgi:hypothetical protein